MRSIVNKPLPIPLKSKDQCIQLSHEDNIPQNHHYLKMCILSAELLTQCYNHPKMAFVRNSLTSLLKVSTMYFRSFSVRILSAKLDSVDAQNAGIGKGLGKFWNKFQNQKYGLNFKIRSMVMHLHLPLPLYILAWEINSFCDDTKGWSTIFSLFASIQRVAISMMCTHLQIEPSDLLTDDL